eukprot:TRINITY_DN9700_c0_g1_i1.p1 TRINITY_DN9700_c0_g1~~TRINITY_DN9700_c0_g1_i1.p1  ORF type:complete len:112 (-),score=14.46 TRINITY_DN9700_c0_g1_i1:248-583(-)
MATPGPGVGLSLSSLSSMVTPQGPPPPTPKRYYGDKALKKLGISAQHLTHNFLGEGVKKGTLSFREYFIFWSEMSRIQQTSMYLKLLIIDLMEVLDKKKTVENAPIQSKPL